jgi:predicted alpha/beta hydrolase family esterase
VEPDMTRQVLFIQGGGEDVHDSWDNKLVDSLTANLGDGYKVIYPRMPDEADPHYEPWAKAIHRELGKLDDGAIVVGHSVGATILINALADGASRTAGIFLISAPFVGEGGWPAEEFDPRPNLGKHLPQSTVIHLYHGDADDEIPTDHVDLYRKAIPQAVITKLTGRDHQLGNDLSEVAADIRSLR